MKIHLMVAGLFLGMMSNSSGLAAPPPAVDFKALMRKHLDAWQTLDPANAAPFYAKDEDDVYFDVAPFKYIGWAAYAAGAKAAYPDLASVKFTIGGDVRTHQRGSIAWATATLHFDLVNKEGTTHALDGRWTLVWEKRGAQWLVVHEHVSTPMPESPTTAGQSLYKRLGGYDSLAAVTDDFLGRMLRDSQLANYFVGHSTDSMNHIRQLILDQLCEATGGPCVYIGRSMKTSHAGLAITDSDWAVAVNHLVETLNQFQVPPREKNEVLGAISNLKGDIVSLGGQ